MATTVLIVEDDAFNLKLFNDLLQAEGYDTLQARDAEGALTLARDRRPDLVLMDMRLPGLSGFEATERLKAAKDTATIPVLGISGLVAPADEARARQAGCVGYLRKPVAVADFLSMVKTALSGAETT